MSLSALYVGKVGHQRHGPRRHRLDYRVFSMLMDLDELPELDRRLRFSATTGLRCSSPVRPRPRAGRRLAAPMSAGCWRKPGSVTLTVHCLLCYPRLLGVCVQSFERRPLLPQGRPLAGLDLRGEQHLRRASQLSDTGGRRFGVIRQSCEKTMYVSPFLPMDCTYHFRVRRPGDRLSLAIHETQEDSRYSTPGSPASNGR